MLMAAAQFVYFILFTGRTAAGRRSSGPHTGIREIKVGSKEARLTAKRNLERPGQMGVNRRLPTVTSSPFQRAMAALLQAHSERTLPGAWILNHCF